MTGVVRCYDCGFTAMACATLAYSLSARDRRPDTIVGSGDEYDLRNAFDGYRRCFDPVRECPSGALVDRTKPRRSRDLAGLPVDGNERHGFAAQTPMRCLATAIVAGPHDIRGRERDHAGYLRAQCAAEESRLGAERAAHHPYAIAIPSEILDPPEEGLKRDLPESRVLSGAAEPPHGLGEHAVTGEDMRASVVDTTAGAGDGQNT